MYFPIENDLYEVKPGLQRLNLDQDKLFVVSEDYPKLCALKRSYAGQRSPVVIHHPNDESLVDHVLLDAASQWQSEYGLPLLQGQRFGMQIEEDLAIIQQTNSGNRLVYLHVSFPNGWDPHSKIPGDFSSIHAPVAHFEKMAANQQKIVHAMIHHGPFVRYAWGVHTSNEYQRLSPDDWQTCPPQHAVFRAERQTTWGFPQYQASLFTIHTQITPLHTLHPAQKQSLANALLSMSKEALAYKGLNKNAVRQLNSWLKGV